MRQRPDPLPHFITNNLSSSGPLFRLDDIFEDGQISIKTYRDAALCTPPPPPVTVLSGVYIEVYALNILVHIYFADGSRDNYLHTRANDNFD